MKKHLTPMLATANIEKIRLQHYLTPSGKEPVKEFIEELPYIVVPGEDHGLEKSRSCEMGR